MSGGGFYSVDSLRGVWVLIVDSDAEGRRTLTDILNYCGALVTAVASPEEALRTMRQVKPDVLVVSLTGVSEPAFDFIRQVRSLKPEDGGMVPTVAVAVMPHHSEETARSRGFDAWLRRPFGPWQLCRVLVGLTTAR